MPRVDLFVDGYEEALQTLTLQAERHPGYADAQHRLGLLHYLAGAPERAVEFHERALAVNPAYAAARSALGYAYAALGDLERAMRHWREHADSPVGSEHPGPRLDLAIAEGRRGMARQGLAELDRLTAGGRHAALIERERVLLLLLAGDAAQASRHLATLRELSPYFQAYFAAHGLTTSGHVAGERVATFLAEREINHNLAEIHAYLGETYAAFESFGRAQAELEAALESDFDLASFHVRMGRLQRLAGDEPASAQAFRDAIGVDANHVQARIELGHELAALGHSRAALEHFSEAARLAPGYADVHYQIGLLWLENGELEASRVAFEQALAVNPDFALARASLALCLMRSGDDERALVAFERAITDGLRSADLFLSVARIHIRLGDTDAALAALERGVSIQPGYAPLHYHLGCIYREMGRKSEALESWRRFFEAADELELADRLELFREDLRSPILAT
ncbi:MAG: tetratricopeptide repeat protein [Candidatus Eiseniibacteriota bacterium]|jgi:tetratricopeptide (TPR) repeat protein